MNGFANRMFAGVVGIFLLLAVMFLVFQYQRETEYKVDILNNRLQVVNYQVASSDTVPTILLPGGCRITIFDLKGNVLFDNEQDAAIMSNHLNRKEILYALKYGSGYDIERSSESMNGEQFFYSATLFKDKGIIVRSALPYNIQLRKDLTIDRTFIIFIIIITLVLCLVLYQIAHRLATVERQRVDMEKQQLKRQLTQNAAHELKTPTASISAYLETILSDPNLPEDTRRHFLERSYVQCQRMKNILSDMSALAKMDAAVIHCVPMRIAMQELLESIKVDSHLALEQNGMTLSINTPVTVMGDRQMVHSIFRNLIDNAIVYAGHGKFVTINATVVGRMAEFFVSDNGVGVPEEHLPHLCERFYRIDKGRSRKLGGTGLGLAIVKNAVLLHGGEIQLTTTPGGGLTVRLTLPIS